MFKSHYPESLTQWIRERFQDQAQQLVFIGMTSSAEHKALYRAVDLNLDPWPQTGGVSACDALHMGVPAVTLIGPRIIQRTTASLLTTLGLTEFIAETPDQYIDTAVAWVTTRKYELAEIRSGLRERFRASPIQYGYLDAVESAYRQAWRAWCDPKSVANLRNRLALVS
jgi:predicted O-linked N-acetylglucosamine transferase (SPINDLY family)